MKCRCTSCAKLVGYRKRCWRKCFMCNNYHLKKVFGDSELVEDSVIRNFRITAADGKSYNTKHYNLAAIIAVGYKVSSDRAVQFRKRATTIIESFTIKGFPRSEASPCACAFGSRSQHDMKYHVVIGPEG